MQYVSISVPEKDANGIVNINEQQQDKNATEIQISNDKVQQTLNETEDPVSPIMICKKYQQSIKRLTFLNKFDEVMTNANISPQVTCSAPVGDKLTVGRNQQQLGLLQCLKDSSDMDKSHALSESNLIITISEQPVENPKHSEKEQISNSAPVCCDFEVEQNNFNVHHLPEDYDLLQSQQVSEVNWDESDTEIGLQCSYCSCE